MDSTIDLNADAGESFGPWPMGRDEELYPLVSSVNLACGFHGGDPATMRRSVDLALRHGVAVGAHPGYPDLVGFGRRDIRLGPDDAYADVLYQLGALDAFLRARGGGLHHVKPHGAMYLRMLEDEALARAVAAAVRSFRADLPLVVLAGSAMLEAAMAEGVPVVAEAFPDRGYLADGRLVPRSADGALVTEPREVARRAVLMATGGPVETIDGATLRLEPRTLCLHGDNPTAVAVAREVRRALEAAGVAVMAF